MQAWGFGTHATNGQCVKRPTFLLLAAGAAAAGATARTAAQAAESPISLTTPTGVIYGTLTLPPKLAAPVVLIVAGSGPTDRDGNVGTIHTNAYTLLATALAAQGIASVRYDKRGVGASQAAAPSERDLRFTNYVDDAVAWLRLLRTDRRFTKIVIAGHSEGSLVGMLALQQVPADGFVSLEGAGRPAPVVLREQLKRNLPPELDAQSEAIIAQLQQGHTVANTSPDLAVLFRPSVQPYLISWFPIDPAAEIAKLHIPITIVQGTADIQVTMDDAHALARGNPSAKLVVVDGMNHVLKHAPDTSSQTAILEGYVKPSLGLEPEAIDAVIVIAK
jgi:pimeloyl-ACP methyl ester carboxylesterase